jgi:hypothetical protein
MNQQKKKKKHKNPTITNGTHLHHLHHLHAHQHFVVEQDRQRERTPTLALRIICEPIVNVGKLIRERQREHRQRKRRSGRRGRGQTSCVFFRSPGVARAAAAAFGLGRVHMFSSPSIQFLEWQGMCVS